MFKPALFHTYPFDCLDQIKTITPVFIEADACLDDPDYLAFFKEREPNAFTVLDCGVGVSPNLRDPMGHVSKDPNWAIRYLNLIIDLSPSVVVVPDALGDSVKTMRNFKQYVTVFDRMYTRTPQLMFVIQGQTCAEAARVVNQACEIEEIAWIGFPRIVQYYYNNDILNGLSAAELGQRRLSFVKEVMLSIRQANKQIHLLGMNSIEELRTASQLGFSMDTRLASMTAVDDIDIYQPRPAGLNIDLTQSLTEEQKQRFANNVKKLDDIYNQER